MRTTFVPLLVLVVKSAALLQFRTSVSPQAILRLTLALATTIFMKQKCIFVQNSEYVIFGLKFCIRKITDFHLEFSLFDKNFDPIIAAGLEFATPFLKKFSD